MVFKFQSKNTFGYFFLIYLMNSFFLLPILISLRWKLPEPINQKTLSTIAGLSLTASPISRIF